MSPSSGPSWRACAAALAAFLAGCSAVRYGRHPSAAPPPPMETYDVSASTRPARERPDELQARADREMAAIDVRGRQVQYYSDLGPDTIDVSGYPAQQRYNYTVYSQVCSRCHTLARSINAPVASRGFWDLYVLGMRAASRVQTDQPITAEQRKAILDFLEYDSRVRKTERQAEFEARTEALKRRYGPFLKERMHQLQQSSQPVILDAR